jgi:hypothetical protein
MSKQTSAVKDLGFLSLSSLDPAHPRIAPKKFFGAVPPSMAEDLSPFKYPISICRQGPVAELRRAAQTGPDTRLEGGKFGLLPAL